MLIEQTIEFELRGHGTLVLHALPNKLVVFLTKPKNLDKSLTELLFCLLLKILQEAMYLAPSR